MPGADGFKAAAGQIRTGANAFSSMTDAVNTTSQTLSSILASQGNCWGNDEAGQAFAKDYVPASQEALQAFHTLIQNIQLLQQNLQQTANAYEGSDEAAKKSLPQEA